MKTTRTVAYLCPRNKGLLEDQENHGWERDDDDWREGRMIKGTHVAPDTKTSIVFAWVKVDTAVMRSIEAITMTASRSATLASALRTTMGTRRRTTTTEAIKDLVSLCTTESENSDMLGSRETWHRGCIVDGKP